MNLDAGAVQTQNSTLNIDNILIFKLFKNSLNGAVFRPLVKLHVNRVPIPVLFR